MKKFLLALVVLVMLGGLGALGYFAYQEFAQPAQAPPAQSSSSEAQSSSQASSSQAPDLNVMVPVHSGADMLDEISYERTKNPDTIGWIYIPDTQISASVLQSYDNSYYLRRNERKLQNVYGCYFADFLCNFGSSQELSSNTVIYGHSDLKDNPEGPRFSQLFKYTDIGFARQHPDIYFATPQEVMLFQVFAVFYTDTGLDYTNTRLDGQGLVSLAQDAKARSLYVYNTEIGPEDKIITLSTCTVEFGTENKEQRFVVMGKLMPPDYEAGSIAELEENPSPVMPNFGVAASIN